MAPHTQPPVSGILCSPAFPHLVQLTPSAGPGADPDGATLPSAGGRVSLKGALKRMPGLACTFVQDPDGCLCFGLVERGDGITALAVRIEHCERRFLPGHLEDVLKHGDHKFHRRVVVIQEHDSEPGCRAGGTGHLELPSATPPYLGAGMVPGKDVSLSLDGLALVLLFLTG